jgi:hypothetical protein
LTWRPSSREAIAATIRVPSVGFYPRDREDPDIDRILRSALTPRWPGRTTVDRLPADAGEMAARSSRGSGWVAAT